MSLKQKELALLQAKIETLRIHKEILAIEKVFEKVQVELFTREELINLRIKSTKAQIELQKVQVEALHLPLDEKFLEYQAKAINACLRLQSKARQKLINNNQAQPIDENIYQAKLDELYTLRRKLSETIREKLAKSDKVEVAGQKRAAELNEHPSFLIEESTSTKKHHSLNVHPPKIRRKATTVAGRKRRVKYKETPAILGEESTLTKRHHRSAPSTKVKRKKAITRQASLLQMHRKKSLPSMHYKTPENDYYSDPDSDIEDRYNDVERQPKAKEVIVLYRGITLANKAFGKEKKDRYKAKNNIAEPLSCSAVKTAHSKNSSRSLHFFSDKVKDRINQLTHDQKARYYQLYVNQYGKYKESLLQFANSQEAPSSEQASTADEDLFQELLNKDSEVISTTLSAREACRYAINDISASKALHAQYQHPNYDETGRPHHQAMGKVIVLILSKDDYKTSTPFYVMQAYAQRRIDLRHNYVHGQEVIHTGIIDKKHLVCEKTIMMPAFNKPYKPHYQNKYGLSKSVFNNYKQKMQQATQYKRRLLEDQLKTHITKHNTKQLEAITQRLIEKSNLVRIYPSYQSGLSFSDSLQTFRKAADKRKAQYHTAFSTESTVSIQEPAEEDNIIEHFQHARKKLLAGDYKAVKQLIEPYQDSHDSLDDELQQELQFLMAEIDATRVKALADFQLAREHLEASKYHQVQRLLSPYKNNIDSLDDELQQRFRLLLIDVDKKFARDKKQAIKKIAQHSKAYSELDPALKKDSDIAIAAIKKSNRLFKEIITSYPEYINDDAFIKATLQKQGRLIIEMPDHIKDNEYYALLALTRFKTTQPENYISKRLLATNRDIIKLAFSYATTGSREKLDHFLDNISPELKSDIDLMSQLIEINMYAHDFCNENIIDTPRIQAAHTVAKKKLEERLQENAGLSGYRLLSKQATKNPTYMAKLIKINTVFYFHCDESTKNSDIVQTAYQAARQEQRYYFPHASNNKPHDEDSSVRLPIPSDFELDSPPLLL